MSLDCGMESCIMGNGIEQHSDFKVRGNGMLILCSRENKESLNDCSKVVLMKECKKKSPVRCLNCKREECDMKKITMILDKLNLLKEVNKEIK